jgi:hypothetical protein
MVPKNMIEGGHAWVHERPTDSCPVAFSLFNTAHGPGHTRVWACWIDQQAAKLTPSK